MATSSTWILSLKIILISAGAVSIAMILKLSVPLIMSFAVHDVPALWSTLLSWLKPPYLYLIINGIIITIAASSRFHQKLDERHLSEPSVSLKPPPSDLRSDFAEISAQPQIPAAESPALNEDEVVVSEVNDVAMTNPEDPRSDFSEISTQPEVGGTEFPEAYEDDVIVSEVNDAAVTSLDVVEQEEEKFVISPSPEISKDYRSDALEKPPVSTRFNRKLVKASVEGGRALKVAKPKRHETLENTWKMITDGRHMPLTRHLRRSEAWENHDRQLNIGSQDAAISYANKSEMLNECIADHNPSSSATASPPPAKLRKEPSLSQDELNRRVEAFIKKINEEMRLQRQESLNQYMEMINRGAY